MRLVTFRYEGRDAVGALRDGQVVDLSRAYARYLSARGVLAPDRLAKGELPEDILRFLAAGDRALDASRRAMEYVDDLSSHGEIPQGLKGENLARPLSEVRLLAPVPRPGKILCIGLNYKDHAEEVGMKLPERPTLFSKFPSCVIGPGDPVILPDISDQVDYEAELAVVIGRTARRVPPEEALDYVAGYTVMNDVSARDAQLGDGQWVRGKSFDTFAPMGPALVTRDEVPDPHNLGVALRLNGETMQKSNTSNLVFGIDRLIAFLSQAITLEPGDVIATGTPPGVGMSRDPQVFLKAGDSMAAEIERVGLLENPVVAG